MRAARKSELRVWDELVAANPDGGHYLQTRAWGAAKAHWGWEPRHLVHESDQHRVAVLFLCRRIPGLGVLWYAPKGPGVTTAEQLRELLPWTPSPNDAFVVKIEPEVRSGGDLSSWNGRGLVKARGDIQSNTATIVIDLRPNEEALLASFKSKTRYNVRLAQRRGVTVVNRAVDRANGDVLYRLLSQTNARNGMQDRPRQYFEDCWQALGGRDQGRLFFAVHEGEVLAGAFVSLLGRRAWYKDGGSSRRNSAVMAPYLLQWEIMRWLRSRGVEDYDMVAVPRAADLSPEHHFAGLHRFKSGFNETITEYVGVWDWPVRPARLRLWNVAGERLARHWTWRVRKDFFY